MDSNGNVSKSIIRGLEQIAEINASNTIKYVHQDILGSTILVTNNAGGVEQEYEYDPFGQMIGGLMNTDDTQNTKYLYTGQEYDQESELYYYHARYYNPITGRFISLDPILGRDGNSLTRNGYVYVLNNPVKYVDERGEEEKEKQLLNELDEIYNKNNIALADDLYREKLENTFVETIASFSPQLRGKTAVSYFKIRGYKLAAELLNQSINGRTQDLVYSSSWRPFAMENYVINSVKDSSEYKHKINSIIEEANRQGLKFINLGSKETEGINFKQGDLFYALHLTDLYVNGSLKEGWFSDKWKFNVKIEDVYDFDHIENAIRITDKLANLFYKDMREGYLSKYTIKINFNDAIKI